MSESTEEKYRRLQREIQGAILRNYPNPKRQGCPGDVAVRKLAANPDSIKAEDDADEHGAWYHITHCSPCYASFLELRDGGRADRSGRGSVNSQADGPDIQRRPGWRRWFNWFLARLQTSGDRVGF